MLPSKVKISGIDYHIEIAEHKSVENGVLMGEITYDKATIYINEELNDQLQVSTLLHEIVHGILYHMGSEMNDNEKFVEGFASGLHQVFKDNNWTFGGEKE
jgi:Zn-dependent peptidase ImmA (M78 family)